MHTISIRTLIQTPNFYDEYNSSCTISYQELHSSSPVLPVGATPYARVLGLETETNRVAYLSAVYDPVLSLSYVPFLAGPKFSTLTDQQYILSLFN